MLIGKDKCKDVNCILVPKRFMGKKEIKHFKYSINQIEEIKFFFDNLRTLKKDRRIDMIEGICVHFNDFMPHQEGEKGKLFYGLVAKDGKKYLIVTKENNFDYNKEIYIHLYIQNYISKFIPNIVSYTSYYDSFDSNIPKTQIIMEDLHFFNYIALNQFFEKEWKHYEYLDMFKNIKKNCVSEFNKNFTFYSKWENFILDLCNIQLETIEVSIQENKESSSSEHNEKYNLFANSIQKYKEYIHSVYFPNKQILKVNLDYVLSPFQPLIKQFYQTLFHFHFNFIFHNDLHDNNIFISNDKKMKVKFIDFDQTSINTINRFPEEMGKKLVNIRNNWVESSKSDKAFFLKKCIEKEEMLQTTFPLLPTQINPYILFQFILGDNTLDTSFLNFMKENERIFQKHFKMIQLLMSIVIPEITNYFTDKYIQTILNYKTIPNFNPELLTHKNNEIFEISDETYDTYSERYTDTEEDYLTDLENT